MYFMADEGGGKTRPTTPFGALSLNLNLISPQVIKIRVRTPYNATYSFINLVQIAVKG